MRAAIIGGGFAGDVHAEALADDIDAVHICTPPSTHARYAAAALRAGKKVFCEKPLSLFREEADSLANLAEASAIPSAESLWQERQISMFVRNRIPSPEQRRSTQDLVCLSLMPLTCS